MITVDFEKTYEGWRKAARPFILEGIKPSDINWNDQTPTLFSETSTESKEVGVILKPNTLLTVPSAFLELAENIAYARDEDRWDLLYRILFRLQYENPNLLKISVDSDMLRAQLLRKAVRRDIHKMHAFVRFKKSVVEGEEIYVAWHRPEHLVVKPATPFFARRFGDRRWSIFTPDESAHWDLKQLTFGPGMEQSSFNAKDDWDEVWKTYYKSIFNPARIKIKAMKLEMAPKYWASMPETALIHDLVRQAPQRLQKMAKNQNQAAVVDQALSLPELKKSALSCVACPLYKDATQTVFGVGPEKATIMIVGEQPGNDEDLEGKPFVGPSGEILDTALNVAQLKREDLYVTNAVKHFKFVRKGKFRLHQKPTGSEMHACKPWLEAEIARVKPQVIVALGTTAATAVLGRLPKITSERGKLIKGLQVAPIVIISWHPAAILRSFTETESQERREQLAHDLRLAKDVLNQL